MRIENIRLINYRQFKELEIPFSKLKENDLHFLVGKNGTGKTNLLNAINWCLYGEESHLSKKSKLLPIINLNSIDETEDGKDIEVLVEVQFNIETGRFIMFSRKSVFRIYKSEKQPMHQRDEFEARLCDNKGNSELISKDDAVSYVERFVPNKIRDFFFFDGERLDDYFRIATTQNIRNAIFVISQIELLENKIEKRLDETLKEFRREAGKLNPRIDEVTNKIEEAKEQLTKVEDEIKERVTAVSKAKDGIRECENKLQGIPDLDQLKKDRLEQKANRKHNRELREEKIKEKQDLLFETGNLIMLMPVIKSAIETIEAKRKKKEIPPSVDSSLLVNILKEKVCSICGTSLTPEIEDRINKLTKEVQLSSTIAFELNNMENPLRLANEKIIDFKTKVKTLTHEINNYEKILEKIEKKISQIDKDLYGYNEKEIKVWVEQQRLFEADLEQNQRRLGILIDKKKEYDDKIKDLESQFDDETNKEQRALEFKKRIDFTRMAYEVVKKTKEVIMRETREKIAAETKKLFFQLIWKKETFKNITISEDYDIDLYHSMGYPCLGSISAAERELLALSFTLALHKISGFDSPILIDTPVARVSDEHRTNMGNIFSTISKEKQIILLFTPAEYSPEISKPLDKLSSNKFNLRLSSDEKEAKLEVI